MNYYSMPGVETIEKLVDFKKMSLTARDEYFNIVRDTVCNMLGISLSDFHRVPKPGVHKRKAVTCEISTARQYFCWLIKREYTPFISFKTIGNYIYSGYDHSSVMYCCSAAQDDIDTGTWSVLTKEQMQENINFKLIDLWQSLRSQDTPAQGKTLLAE